MQFKFSALGVSALFFSALATALTSPLNDTTALPTLDDAALPTFDDMAAEMLAEGCSCGFECIKTASDQIGCPDIKCACQSVEELTKPTEKCIKKNCAEQLTCARKMACKYCPGPRKCVNRVSSFAGTEVDGEEEELDEKDDMSSY